MPTSVAARGMSFVLLGQVCFTSAEHRHLTCQDCPDRFDVRHSRIIRTRPKAYTPSLATAQDTRSERQHGAARARLESSRLELAARFQLAAATRQLHLRPVLPALGSCLLVARLCERTGNGRTHTYKQLHPIGVEHKTGSRRGQHDERSIVPSHRLRDIRSPRRAKILAGPTSREHGTHLHATAQTRHQAQVQRGSTLSVVRFIISTATFEPSLASGL